MSKIIEIWEPAQARIVDHESMADNLKTRHESGEISHIHIDIAGG
jgi:hypothetical protein